MRFCFKFLLTGFLFNCAIGLHDFHNEVEPSNQLIWLKSLDTFSGTSLRAKRETNDAANICFDLDVEKSLNSSTKKQTFDGETKTAFGIEYLSENTIVTIAFNSSTYSESTTTVYRSIDAGATFEDISSRLDNGGNTKYYIRNIFQSPVISNWFIFAGGTTFYNQNILWINAGSNFDFTKVILPFVLNPYESDFKLHPSNENYILVQSDTQQLYFSNDFGLNWDQVASDVIKARWCDSDTAKLDFFYTKAGVESYTYSELNHLNLYRSSGGDRIVSLVAKGIHQFDCKATTIYFSKGVNVTINDNRVLYVSHSRGDKWNLAKIPGITPEQFFVMLDVTPDGFMMVHVASPGRTSEQGTIFTSDTDGIIFTESLRNHGYIHSDTRKYTDFYKVESLRGVYLTSQIQDDGTVVQKITFDRGGSWINVPLPTASLDPNGSITCPDHYTTCSLHILHEIAEYANLNSPSVPLSNSNAIGIIMANGQVSDALLYLEPDMFVSDDGGYSWTLVFAGPHFFNILNQGGLLIAIKHEGQIGTDSIKFSYDEGQCWYQYKFTDEPVYVHGLLSAPGKGSLKTLIWGQSPNTHQWITVAIDFNSILKKSCTVDDYITWTAHNANGNDGCLLGYKERFLRLKKSSLCSNPTIISSGTTGSIEEACVCTANDYECNYGFSRSSDGSSCKPSPDVHPEICVDGVLIDLGKNAYRKIPGNKCEGGNFNTTYSKATQSDKICPKINSIPDTLFSDAIVVNKQGFASSKNHSNASVWIVLLLSIVIVLAILGVCYKQGGQQCQLITSSILRRKEDGLSSFHHFANEESEVDALHYADSSLLSSHYSDLPGRDLNYIDTLINLDQNESSRLIVTANSE